MAIGRLIGFHKVERALVVMRGPDLDQTLDFMSEIGWEDQPGGADRGRSAGGLSHGLQAVGAVPVTVSVAMPHKPAEPKESRTGLSFGIGRTLNQFRFHAEQAELGLATHVDRVRDALKQLGRDASLLRPVRERDTYQEKFDRVVDDFPLRYDAEWLMENIYSLWNADSLDLQGFVEPAESIPGHLAHVHELVKQLRGFLKDGLSDEEILVLRLGEVIDRALRPAPGRQE